MKGCAFLVMLPFVIPIALVFIFIVKLILKGKAEGWKGKIVDKTHTSKRGSFEDSEKVEHYYALKVLMSDGKERNIAVSGQFYSECEVGDEVEKSKGSLYPRKVQS